jgi:epoxyqueuosine reductase
MSSDLKSFIITRSLALGFDQIGMSPAEPLPGHRLQTWLADGCHGEMAYMTNHQDLRLDPCRLLPGATTVLVLAANYYTPFPLTTDPSQGAISRYAWGKDYHDVLRKRLQQLVKEIQTQAPETKSRVFVDSAPVLEKEWAIRAGIGWMGKHSCIISPKFGSWIFLAEIILDLELPADEPIKNRCGSCRLCVEACPTGALVRPYVVDSRKCISYLTIEQAADRGIPAELQLKMANRIFGCDVCQSVCPWNNKLAKPTQDPSFFPKPQFLNAPLAELVQWSEEKYSQLATQSPIKRAKYAGFIRNVQAALANLKSARVR